MSTNRQDEDRAKEGLKITHSEGRWLPIVRSQESLDQALRGDCRLLGERVRTGAVSHDEREFLDDFVNGRIKPGKGLYNQRLAKARQQRVADFVSTMKRENPQMQLKAIVDAARERFRIARSEVFTSIKEHAVTVTNDMVALRATEMAKAQGGDWIDHVVEARKQLEDELAKKASVTEPVVEKSNEVE
jgi:hypothetical protein